MVLNNTKGFQCTSVYRKGKTGLVLKSSCCAWTEQRNAPVGCTVDPARKIRVGNKLYFGEDDMLVAEVVDNTTSRGRTIRFIHEGTSEKNFAAFLICWEKHLCPNTSNANLLTMTKTVTRQSIPNMKEWLLHLQPDYTLP